MHLLILADTQHDGIVHLAQHNFAGVENVTICTHEGAIRGLTADEWVATEQIQTKPRYEAMLASAMAAVQEVTDGRNI